MAKRLQGFSFPDEFNLSSIAVHDRAANGDIHNCYPSGKHNVAVQFYLGGAQRTIGYTDNANDAARFADMARVRFHQYRSRGSTIPLTDQDMNLDLNQVRVDIEEVPEAVALLDDIEHLLLQAGLIKSNATRMAECQEHFRNQPPRVQHRQTQKAELLATLKSIDDRLGAIEAVQQGLLEAWNSIIHSAVPPAEGVKPVTGYPNINGLSMI